MPQDVSLFFHNLIIYACCKHCKEKYCPGFKGHYSKCPAHGCIEGGARKVS